MTKINEIDINSHLHAMEDSFSSMQESTPQGEEENLDELLSRARILPTDVIPEPPICLEIVTGNESSTMGTLGNFSAIIGKAKSRKTFLVSMGLATLLRSDTLMDKFRGNLPRLQEKVILFDTEQSKYHVQKVLRRICRLIEINEPENFLCYGLRPYDTNKRVEVIEHALSNIPNIGMVVIDGIRDLVHDINDPSEATKITNSLMRWTEEKNIHLVVVIHQNKGDSNARGHLGSEIVNKAETVISVTKDAQDSEMSIVEPEYCRDKDFPPFAFRIDPRGLPYIDKDWQPVSKGKKPQSTPFDFPKETHDKILAEVFKNTDQLQYGEFWKGIKFAFQKNGMDGKDNKAKDWAKYHKEMGFVIYGNVEGKKYPMYRLKGKELSKESID